jgi:hypothetical protein
MQALQMQVKELNKLMSDKEANHMASMAALNEMFRLKREESDTVSDSLSPTRLRPRGH